MVRPFKRILAAAAAIMACVYMWLPWAHANVLLDYNEHDAAKLRSFFEYVGSPMGSNGALLFGVDYDADDPSTWSCCTWNAEGRLKTISVDNFGVSGTLDLDGCEALTYVWMQSCMLSELIVTGCPNITTINVDGSSLTSIDVSDNALLAYLNISKNDIAELDLSGNALLADLQADQNKLAYIDLSPCTGLTKLNLNGNLLEELDVSFCPLLTILNCNDNMLSALDISACTSLTQLRCARNRFKTLDISVLNGGASCVLNAIGDGYISVGCKYLDGGYRLLANAEAYGGAEFFGWLQNSAEGDDYISTEATDFVIPFADGDMSLNAMFSGALPHDPSGDVNGDGIIDSVDALILLRYSLDLVESSELILTEGDCDGNGVIDSIDALLVLRMSVGLN